MAAQTSCYYYFIDNTLDGNWGTCDLQEFVEAYESRRQAPDEAAYVDGTRLLQQINAEQYIGCLLYTSTAFPAGFYGRQCPGRGSQPLASAHSAGSHPGIPQASARH